MALAGNTHVPRNTVPKIIRTGASEFTYERETQPYRKLGDWRDELERLLTANAAKRALERLILTRIFEGAA